MGKNSPSIIKGRAARAMREAQLRNGSASLGLLQDVDDLIVGVLELLHRESSLLSLRKIPVLTAAISWGDYHLFSSIEVS